MTKKFLISSGNYTDPANYVRNVEMGREYSIHYSTYFLIFNDDELIMKEDYLTLIKPENKETLKAFKEEVLSCDEVYTGTDFGEIFSLLFDLDLTNAIGYDLYNTGEYTLKEALRIAFNILTVGNTETYSLSKDKVKKLNDLFIESKAPSANTLLFNMQYLNEVKIPLADLISYKTMLCKYSNLSLTNEIIIYAEQTGQLKDVVDKLIKEARRTKTSTASLLEELKTKSSKIKKMMIECNEEGIRDLVNFYASKLKANYNDFYVIYEYGEYIDFDKLDMDMIRQRFNDETLKEKFGLEFDDKDELPKLYKTYVGYFQTAWNSSRAESFLDLCPVEDFKKYKDHFISATVFRILQSRSTDEFMNLNMVYNKENLKCLIVGLIEALNKRGNERAIRYFNSNISYLDIYKELDFSQYPKYAKVVMKELLKNSQ